MSSARREQSRCWRHTRNTKIHTYCCYTGDSILEARNKVSSDKLQSAFDSNGGSKINELSQNRSFQHVCSHFCCQKAVCNRHKAAQRTLLQDKIAMQEEKEIEQAQAKVSELNNGLQLDRSQKVKEEEINVEEDLKRSSEGEKLNLNGGNSGNSCDGRKRQMMVEKDVMQLPRSRARRPLVYVAKFSRDKRKDIHSFHNSLLFLLLLLLQLLFVATTLSIINHQHSYQLLGRKNVNINTNSKYDHEDKVLHKDNNYNGHSSDDKRPMLFTKSKAISSRLSTYLRFPSFQVAQAALIDSFTNQQQQQQQQRQATEAINVKARGLKVEQKNESAIKSALPGNLAASNERQDQTKSRPLANIEPTNKLIPTNQKLLKTTSTLPASLNWKNQQNNKFGNNKRNQNSFLVIKNQDDSEINAQNGELPTFNNSSFSSTLSDNSKQLQISITARLSLIRVPVESNAILKCLISSQANKFTKKFNVHWSRYMYDENVYEQIESFSNSENNNMPASELHPSQETPNFSEYIAGTGVGNGEEDEDKPVNRQQQLRDFLSRTRQEINVINELLIEATLSISLVKASDNASYYCTATDGLSDQKARIDLVALSKPIVQLDRVVPARDSKSAIIYWIIISDGNTPIKKTILMVKNDTIPNRMQNSESASSNSFIPISVPKQESIIETQQQQQQYSSVVIDSDYNQWQRIEIADDGEESNAEQMMMTSQNVPNLSKSWSSYDLNRINSMGGDNNVVSAADVDVVSSPIGQSNRNAPGEQDMFNTGISDSSSSSSNRSRWKLGRFNNRRRRSFNLTSLLPGVTYNFRLAAINDLGQSNWTQLVTTMPNEIPAQISEIFLLSRSNDSLTIGWRRPSYDGAKTIRYEMQLFDLNRTIEMNANTHTPPTIQGRNFMYIFVNLNPGTDYHFHIRACSKVGCSLFSSPKLLATTLDGEPDEPIDVELNCQYESSNVTVSWLPPINIRGQLLNYSIQFDSYSKYKNLSGHWTVDEWRSTMETSDNHTLIFELGRVLVPNTNYSVRVCANNRSKHCGRLSMLSSQTQCSTPPELPNEIPADIKLTAKSLNLTNNNAGDDSSTISVDNDEEGEMAKLKKKSNLESLLLELPFLSLRNGTINCIQVILIRLPKSFDGDASQLHQFLPNQPSDIKLSHLIDLFEYEQSKTKDNVQQNNKQQRWQQQLIDGDKAVAYLAEEIESINQINDNDTSTSANKSHNIILGDGFQNSCQSLNNISVLNENSNLILNNANSEASKAFRVFDGSLKAQTFYTGFIKLILVRNSDNTNNFEQQQQQRNDGIQKRKSKNNKPEILTKYSNYFNLVKTSDSVIEVPIPTNNDVSTTGVHIANKFSLDSQMNIQDMADKVKLNLKTGISKMYNSTMKFISNKINVDSISDYIVHSTPMMQIFQVGMIVLVLSLFILLALYLLLLPASMRRKRKMKLKKKNQNQKQKQQTLQHQHQDQQQQQQLLIQQEQEQLKMESSEQNYLIPNEDDQQDDEQRHTHQSSFIHQTNGLNQMFDVAQNGSMAKVDYQQLDDGQVLKQGSQLYSESTHRSHECPIHSSPLTKQQVCDLNLQQTKRSQQVYQQIQSSQTPSMYQRDPAYGTIRSTHHHAHHHHNQLTSNYTNQELARQEQYERNCRTTRRVSAGQNGYQLDLAAGGRGDVMNLPNQQANLKNTFTLNHQNSVLALAKKINKSIPIRLFASVFECRLRNGWLKEEYEQLPRQAILVPPHDNMMMANNQQLKMTQSNNFCIQLQPQLVVVSRTNNNVSALISGNDQYDASLIKIPLTNDINEKRIICARSPLDADSVWDFWRLVYEQGIDTIVMLTQNEDQNTGEIRCAQYWPTCDNEETTILSPCNEYVQKSNILPAKFKIRQETFEDESRENDFKVRRLTLIVMATKPGENEQNEDGIQSLGGETTTTTDANGTTIGVGNGEAPSTTDAAATAAEDDDEEELIIIERNITHLQFYHWNTSSLNNQMRLIKFIEMANERHSKTRQKISNVLSPSENSNYDTNGGDGSSNNKVVFNNSPMLIHCFNGIGRSGLFAAMSFIIDDLAIKLNYEQQLLHHLQHHHQQQQISQQDKPLAKLNIFQLVSRLRSQREMLLSPYRFYELLYQLTCNCIPVTNATTITTAIPNTTSTDINEAVTNAAQEHPAQISARIMH